MNQHWLTAAEVVETLGILAAHALRVREPWVDPLGTGRGGPAAPLPSGGRPGARRPQGGACRHRGRRAGDALRHPALASSLTLIADGRLFYRGRDARVLAAQATLEDVARLLWPSDDSVFAPGNRPPRAKAFARGWDAVAGLAPLERCLALLPQAAALDADAWSLDPLAIRLTGARLLRLLVAIVVGRPPSAVPTHVVLAGAWQLDSDAREVVRAALVLCADHELNPSTFAARVVAATGATVYAVVGAGLAALSGPRHGGQAAQVHALFDALQSAPDVEAALRERVRQGLAIPGFGHRLYPDGDVRAIALVEALLRIAPTSERLRFVRRVASAGEVVSGLRPNLDVALAAVERVLALPRGAALSIFLLGRSVGWIAHMLEQAAQPDLIRPRAHYVGPAPEA